MLDRWGRPLLQRLHGRPVSVDYPHGQSVQGSVSQPRAGEPAAQPHGEDSVTVTSVLIPWNSCGMTQATVLGVGTLTYLPYCFFNLLSPLMSILVAITGFKIKQGIAAPIRPPKRAKRSRVHPMPAMCSWGKHAASKTSRKNSGKNSYSLLSGSVVLLKIMSALSTFFGKDH